MWRCWFKTVLVACTSHSELCESLLSSQEHAYGAAALPRAEELQIHNAKDLHDEVIGTDHIEKATPAMCIFEEESDLTCISSISSMTKSLL